MTKKSGYIPVDNSFSQTYPSEGQDSQRLHGPSHPISRQSKPTFGWTKIPYLSKFSSTSANNNDSTKTDVTACSMTFATTKTYPEVLSPTKSASDDNKAETIEIHGVGRIHPWSSCVWKPNDYQRHATNPMDFLRWSSRNNLAEASLSKVSRMGLLILDQHVVQSHYPWHMQKESAKPSSFFDYKSGHDDDQMQEEEEEDTEDATFCGKQLYPTRYFVSSSVNASSQNSNDITLLPMVPIRSDWDPFPVSGNKVSSSEIEQGWTEYDEWYARSYYERVGSCNSSSRVHDERMDFPYLRLNRASMRMDCTSPKDSHNLYKELDPFKIPPYTVQTKRVASTMYTYPAIAGCTISPGNTMFHLCSFR